MQKVLLFWHKMEIPLEVIRSLLFLQATVVTIMAFEPGKVTFQAVC